VLASACAALACAAVLAAGAFASTSPTQTREGYVARVEPICKTNTTANERILSNVRKEIKQGKLKLAAGQFAQAAAAFGKATKQISAVPQPVADQAKLTKWLGLLGEEQRLLGEIGKALKAEKKGKAQSLSLKLTRNGNAANNAVLGFEFNYCLVSSSRFS
jgi:nitrogenase molybdenum-iron protein alpha/beta subunit